MPGEENVAELQTIHGDTAQTTYAAEGASVQRSQLGPKDADAGTYREQPGR